MDRHSDDEEMEAATVSLGYHKAAAKDGTKNPLYRCGGKEMRTHLLSLFNYLLDREVAPDSWQRALVVNLIKDGDVADPENYRGIALISCLGKLYLSLWAQPCDTCRGCAEQGSGGFRRRRSTVDQAIAVKELLLSRTTGVQTGVSMFHRLRKAFDTVWHDGLWRRLWDSGVKGKAWRIIRALYSNIHAQVLVGGSGTGGGLRDAAGPYASGRPARLPPIPHSLQLLCGRAL